MEIDQEELLQRTYALAKENNKLLKKLRHSTWIGVIVKLVFWVVMLGVPIWMYFTFFQPILKQSMNTLGQMQNMVGQAQEVSGGAGAAATQVQDLLKTLPRLDILEKFTQ